MPDFKIECKQCGAEIQCGEGAAVVACPYCESRNTVARTMDARGGLFNRANYLRRNGEFERALAAYEDVLRQDNTEYEAHWGIVLCRYGIEYVEDPAAGKRVPTIHRAQYDSILNDPEYLAACEYAPQEVRTVYEEEAAYIGRVQKDILALAQKQERYDVFLCYKETDAAGNRTEDSVLAQELEFELSKRGYRVFFARKTLSGKLGTAYEPVIFSALHSARVMVALGTRPEHFTAVWVKNEWGRYRELIKKGEARTLIPAYRGMSPYDLPEAFQDLQALDMGKLGFVQDLCDGIDRLSRSVKQPPAAAPAPVAAPGVESLLTRAQLFMEDGDWASAAAYIEKVLDIDPKYAPAYIARLMAELKVSDEKKLADQEKPLTENASYQKALRFADGTKKAIYEGYNRVILDRLENERRENIYQSTINLKALLVSGLNYGNSSYDEAAKRFRTINGYKDADAQAEECENLAEKARVTRENAERRARAKAEQERIERERKAEQERIATERLRKRRNRRLAIGIPLSLALVVALLIITKVIIPAGLYREAEALMRAGKYAEASTAFAKAGNYSDAANRVNEPYYVEAEALLDAGKYRDALVSYMKAGDYQDSVEKSALCKRNILLTAKKGDIVYLGAYEQDNDTANGPEAIAWRVLGVKDGKALMISEKNLDAKPYNKEYISVTWESCSLRAWLNGEFLDSAFTDAEKSAIAPTTLANPDNPIYGTEGGRDTQDRVFLLSLGEAETYFAGDDTRKAQNTAYAKARRAYEKDGYGWWWMRSPGDRASSAADVRPAGSLNEDGSSVNDVVEAVRPALYIDLGF